MPCPLTHDTYLSAIRHQSEKSKQPPLSAQENASRFRLTPLRPCPIFCPLPRSSASTRGYGSNAGSITAQDPVATMQHCPMQLCWREPSWRAHARRHESSREYLTVTVTARKGGDAAAPPRLASNSDLRSPFSASPLPAHANIGLLVPARSQEVLSGRRARRISLSPSSREARGEEAAGPAAGEPERDQRDRARPQEGGAGSGGRCTRSLPCEINCEDPVAVLRIVCTYCPEP